MAPGGGKSSQCESLAGLQITAFEPGWRFSANEAAPQQCWSEGTF
jgi:hypothetical protein